MSIAARLQKLEQSQRGRSCGHGCPPVRVLYANNPLGWQSEPPAACPRCGRQSNVVCVVYDPDFYGNAERLASSKLEDAVIPNLPTS
jgi:hypothetical protein